MCSWFGEGGLAEGVFAALGPVANKSGTDEEIAFFFSCQPRLSCLRTSCLEVGGLSRVLAFQVGRHVGLQQPPSFWRT